MLKRSTYIIGALAILFLSAVGYFFFVKWQGNFHPITPGEAYRSAQLDRDDIAHYVTKYSIKSVLNLRGSRSGERWYDDELAACAELQVAHYDVELSEAHEPTDIQVRQLVHIFETAPRPLLIHCMSGADRTGLAAAMWKVVVDKERKAEAANQLSIRYGHIPIWETQAMDSFFEKWNP
jgi:undecaprenyl-diphosphatase